MEKDEGLEDFLLDGLRLLQMDALGGNGSRGYGKIEFGFDDKEIQEKFNQITPL
jgi:CRISPR-associated protein Csm3